MNQNAQSQTVAEGTLLWEPNGERIENARVTRFLRWMEEKKNLRFSSYQELWKWSTEDLEGFWGSLWEYFGIKAHSPYSRVLADRSMPGARWFPGATLNYAEHALARRDQHPAIISKSELRPLSTLTFGDLYGQVASVAAALRSMGVGKGDRVVGYMPNIEETVVAGLAAASIGAIWASCAPEFGERSVIERFQQIGPKVLFATDGYRFGGKDYSRINAVAEICRNVPELKRVVVTPYVEPRPALDQLPNAVLWQDLQTEAPDLVFEPVPFDHPLWVLFSSGTTGPPKPIVHGHGGVILEHLKCIELHFDLDRNDRLFWFTTTGWMMWNFVMSGLIQGMTIILYDGNPLYPDIGTLWRLAQDARATYYGASAPFIHACMKDGIRPGRKFDLSRLKGLASTGAPLSPEGFQWVYENIGPDIHLGSYCGGTDICTGFLGPVPLLPVHAGEIQAACLGARAEALDAEGQPVVNEVGELALTAPMPSMPLYFWNDPDGERYRQSYFDHFPGVWRHGDWTKKTERSSFVVYGRSDSTLNRSGVRMGASEFYRVVEELEEVQDSMIIDTGHSGKPGRLLLFLQLRKGDELDHDLRSRIISKIRRQISPRHSPDEIYAVPEVPKTINDKKMEVPVKRILAGHEERKVINRDAMANPDSLEFFYKLAPRLNR